MHYARCIGGEFHFFFKCNVLNDLRKRYLSIYYCKHPSVIKMNKLFYKHSKVVLMNSCQYLKQCFKKMTRTVIYISISTYNCSPFNLINF